MGEADEAGISKRGASRDGVEQRTDVVGSLEGGIGEWSEGEKQ